MKLTKLSRFSNPHKSYSQSLPNSTRKKWLQNKNINLKIELGNPYPTFTLKQKEFTKPRPAREYTRFPKTKIALTGMDVSGNLLEFMSKDIITPLKKPNLYEDFDIKSIKNLNNKDLDSSHPNHPKYTFLTRYLILHCLIFYIHKGNLAYFEIYLPIYEIYILFFQNHFLAVLLLHYHYFTSILLHEFISPLIIYWALLQNLLLVT
jgi:hypothetical protein